MRSDASAQRESKFALEQIGIVYVLGAGSQVLFNVSLAFVFVAALDSSSYCQLELLTILLIFSMHSL